MTSHGAPVTATQTPWSAVAAKPAEQDLEDGGVRRVADDALGEGRGRRVQRPCPRYAEVGPAHAPEVLHQHRGAGLAHVEAHRLTNLTRVPGASRAGSSRPGSHSSASVWPMICHPPGEATG